MRALTTIGASAFLGYMLVAGAAGFVVSLVVGTAIGYAVAGGLDFLLKKWGRDQ